MSVLEEILSKTRSEVDERKKIQNLPDPLPSDRDFYTALNNSGLSLISEIKRSSPSRGVIREDFNPETIANIYGRHASAISVLTNQEYFGGSHEYLSRARAVAPCPILAKDFFVDPFQIYEARVHGADAILLMASALDIETINTFLEITRELNMGALVEVHNQEEIRQVLEYTDAPIVGFNNRDLNTLKIDIERFFEFAPQIRAANRTVVAESGFFTRPQIDRLRPIADAVLIGSSIMLAEDIEAKIKELGW